MNDLYRVGGLQKNRRLIFWIIISFVYSMLKMYRNSINNTSTSSGGIWNVLNASFVAFAFLLLLFYSKNKYHLPPVIRSAYIFSFYITIVSLLTPRALSISVIFLYLMLFYFASVSFVLYYSAKAGIGESEYRVYSIFYYLLASFSLFLVATRLILGRTQIYVSDAYFLLCALPLTMFMDKGKRLYIKLALLIVVLIFAAKRTGFLAFVGALLVYYFIEAIQASTLNSYLKNVLRILIGTIVFAVIYGWLEQKYNVTLLNRMKTISTDGGSGRDVIYLGVWKAIKGSNPIDWIIGHGIGGIQYVYGRKSGAHDDFLEIIYNYGWIAFGLFIELYIKMFACLRKMIVSGYPKANSVGAAIVISLFMSLFSNYFVTFTHITMVATFWGIVLADWESYQYKMEGMYGDNI